MAVGRAGAAQGGRKEPPVATVLQWQQAVDAVEGSRVHFLRRSRRVAICIVAGCLAASVSLSSALPPACHVVRVPSDFPVSVACVCLHCCACRAARF